MNATRKPAGLWGMTLLLSAATLSGQPAKAPDGAPPFHPTRIIAKYAASGGATAKASALKGQALGIQYQFELLPQTVVLDLADAAQAKATQTLAPAEQTRQLQARIAALRASGQFEYVEPDYARAANLEPTDAAYTNGTLWALHNFGQNGGVPGADIGAAAAWNLTTGSTNVIVAVVDTGIRYTHQDLAAQMWHDPAATNFVCGTNAVAGNSDPMDDSVDRYGNLLGHGTHVAGTIGAAANDGNPHVGVAWKVRLMACKFLDASGGGFTSDEIRCFEFALSHGARIINASFGGYYYSQAEYEAIRNLRDHGVLLVAAAGNEAWNNDSWLRSYPASHDLHNILSVAALDRTNHLADFSNLGQTTVHLGAPGVEIFSSVNSSNSAYGVLAGTSMAAPHVSGVAALVLARYPNITLAELRRRILDGSVPVADLASNTITGGRLNAYNALTAAPVGLLHVEVTPRTGQPFPAGRTATLHAIVTDVSPVTNATALAAITGFTNLTLLDGGVAPDVLAGDGAYSVSFVVPTNLSTLQVALRVSSPGWPETTNLLSYPVVFPPANDDFANRTTIPTNTCGMTVTGSNLNGSMEAGEPISAGQVVGHSVWWSWTAPASGPVKVTTYGSALDTVLAVYTGTIVSNLTLAAANDDAAYYDYYSVVRFDATAGVQYQVAVDGYAGSQGSITLSVMALTSAIPVDVAVDCPGLASTTGGTAPWLGQTCVVLDGPSAARSGPIDANGQSWIEATLPGPGTLTFWWKVSCESGWDFLSFSMDDTQQAAMTGEGDWQQQTFALARGNHRLRWAFTKDYCWGGGQDAAWLDGVSFTPAKCLIPQKMGDLDGDGQPTILDLTLLAGFLRDTNSLRPEVALFADVNRDGLVKSNDIPALVDAIMGRSSLLPALDADGDGIPDVLEKIMGLDPTRSDSLGDGVSDANRDGDMDGLSNAHELLIGTNPMRADSDGDGWSDEAELTVNSDPLDAKSRPFLMVVSSPPVALVLPANEGPGGLACNTVVAQPPVALVLPANQGPEGLALNTTVAQPPVSLVLPADEGPGGLSNNTIVAMPPVALVLPWNTGAGGLAPNTTVAQPPVALLLPADQGSGGLSLNTTLAFPPLSLLLPWDQGTVGLSNNTVIAHPPVTIKLEAP